MNKEFFKALFRGDKKAYKVTDVKHINVPKLDELGIKSLMAMMKDDDLIR